MKKAEMKQKISAIFTGRKFGRIGRIVICALACLAILLGLLASFVSLRLFLLVFPVRDIEVTGDTYYDMNEIIDASEIKSGSSLYGLNKRQIEKSIVEGCPYVKSVKVKCKFPGTVQLEIEERVAGWYIQIGNDFYALDYDMKVLNETYNEEELTLRGLTKLELPELESAIVGEYPSFGNGDELLISETLKAIDTIRTHRIKEHLTYLDLTNRFQIKLTVDETFDVNFGDMKDAQTKFAMIEKIVEESEFAGYVGGEINVINPLAHSFKPIFNDEADDQDNASDVDDEEEYEE